MTGDGPRTRSGAAWADAAGRGVRRARPRRARRRALTESRAAHRSEASVRRAPRFSPDGPTIAYTSQTLTRFPEIRLVRRGRQRRPPARAPQRGLRARVDARRQGAGLLPSCRCTSTYTVFGDLSLVDASRAAASRRLTRGRAGLRPRRGARRPERSCSPASSATAPSSAWSGSTAGTCGRSRPRRPASSGAARASARAGTSIVASRLLPGGWLDLVLVDPATGAVEQLTHDRAKDVEPSWMPDGEAVVFRSDRDGVSNLYALRLADRVVVRVTNVLGGAFQPSVEPRRPLGRVLRLLLARLRRADRAARSRERARPRRRSSTSCRRRGRSAARRRRPRGRTVPWSMLWPRFWTPWIELDDRRQPHRPRDRRLRRAVPPRLGRARDLRHRHRARQLQRLLPLRPLPPHADRERAGHHQPRPARGARARASSTCRPSLPLRRTIRSDPDALARLAARARGGARQPRSRRTALDLGGPADEPGR